MAKQKNYDTTPYSIRLRNDKISKLQAAGVSIQSYIQIMLDNTLLDKVSLELEIKKKEAELEHLMALRSINPISDTFMLSEEEREALKHSKEIIGQKGPDKFLGQRKLFNRKFGKHYDSATFKKLMEELK